MQLSAPVKASLLTAVFTVVLFFILNAIFSYFNIPFTALSSASNQAPFTVQGTGTATATPDKAQISFSVSKTATKLQDAQNQANTSTNSIVSDVEKLGITKENIQTNNYNSSPNYDINNSSNGGAEPMTIMRPVDNSQTVISYTVSQDVTITVADSNKVNTVIDAITKDGAENISGPNYTFSDSSQESLQNKARDLAIQDAKQKAQSIAQAAGIHLGRITNVQEDNGGSPIQPMVFNAKATAVAGSAPTQINPGQNTVTVNITLSYATN